MKQSVKSVLSQYATFGGRASRSEYWWFALAFFLLFSVAFPVMAILSMAIPSGDRCDRTLAELNEHAESSGDPFTQLEQNWLREVIVECDVFTTPLTFLPIVLFSGISLAYLGSIIPGLAVGSRRLHDANKSGWYQLIGLVPFIGGIALIVLYTLPSDKGENKYGSLLTDISDSDDRKPRIRVIK